MLEACVVVWLKVRIILLEIGIVLLEVWIVAWNEIGVVARLKVVIWWKTAILLEITVVWLEIVITCLKIIVAWLKVVAIWLKVVVAWLEVGAALEGVGVALIRVGVVLKIIRIGEVSSTRIITAVARKIIVVGDGKIVNVTVVGIFLGIIIIAVSCRIVYARVGNGALIGS